MQFIHALSLAPDVRDWLANSHQPRILHIFDQACNLINEHGRVLSIVTPQIGNGPFNLVVADEICFLEHCDLESLIYLSSAQFMIGHLVIHTTDVKLWNPRPDWEMLHARKGDIGDQLTQLRITDSLNIGGFDPFFGEHSGLPITQSLISNLSRLLVNVDISSVLNVTSQLAGLGVGLTPAGDDLIMGAIYAAWIIHPFEIASILARDVAETAMPLTTSLSAAWLRSAGRGEAGILWHGFFDALISKNLTKVEESIKNILAVGETSGADALAGFIGVFVSWMETAGSSHA